MTKDQNIEGGLIVARKRIENAEDFHRKGNVVATEKLMRSAIGTLERCLKNYFLLV